MQTKLMPRTEMRTSPFVNSLNMGSVELLKVVIMSLIVAPVRLALMGFLAIIVYAITLATLLNQQTVTQIPFKGIRKAGKTLAAKIVIWIHLIAGFHVTVKGKRAAPWEAPILVLAPHSSFFDALPHCIIGAPSVVAKKSLFNIPVVGSLLRMTTPIIVDRESKDSRRETREKIKERALKAMSSRHSGEEWPQVAIFPEGTCTNRSQLISFKSGAFCPQFPVQPICLKWSMKKPDSISWTYETPGVLQLLWVSLCRLRHKLEVEYLPIYVPSDAEKADATLYARNVRDLMARCLDLPMTEYNLDDAPYLSNYSKPKFEYFVELCSILPKPTEPPCNLNSAWNELKNSQFSSQFYHTEFNGFLEFLHLEYDEKFRRLFNTFDWECTGHVDLREFILTRYCRDFDPVAYLRHALEIFCCDGTSVILNDKEETRYILNEHDFIKIVRFPFCLSLYECRKLYKKCSVHTADTNQRIIVQSQLITALDTIRPISNNSTTTANSEGNPGHTWTCDSNNFHKNGYRKLQKI